ncbi:MAG: PaaI family thioesterase [Christensenellales bacterium]
MDYEALRCYLNENDPYSKYSHVQIVKLEPGKSEVKMEIGPENQNFMGFLHGGAFYTLADVAGGGALLSNNSRCVTLQADLHFLHQVHGKSITAYGRCVHMGHTTGVSEVKMMDEAGHCVAVCTCTMFFTGEKLDALLKTEK